MLSVNQLFFYGFNAVLIPTSWHILIEILKKCLDSINYIIKKTPFHVEVLVRLKHLEIYYGPLFWFFLPQKISNL